MRRKYGWLYIRPTSGMWSEAVRPPWESENKYLKELKIMGYKYKKVPVAMNEKKDWIRLIRCFKIILKIFKIDFAYFIKIIILKKLKKEKGYLSAQLQLQRPLRFPVSQPRVQHPN